jgi:hypothetical protein
MMHKFDGTLGELALSMADGESLIVRRQGNVIDLFAAVDPDAPNRLPVADHWAIEIHGPESQFILEMGQAVGRLFEHVRAQYDRETHRRDNPPNLN